MTTDPFGSDAVALDRSTDFTSRFFYPEFPAPGDVLFAQSTLEPPQPPIPPTDEDFTTSLCPPPPETEAVHASRDTSFSFLSIPFEAPDIRTTVTSVGDCVENNSRPEEVSWVESRLASNTRPFVATPTTPQPRSPLPSAPAFPTNWIEIQQRSYSQRCKQLGFRPMEPIYFSTKDFPGINLKDALHKDFAGLNGCDDTMPGDLPGVISCRLLFPGYSNHNGSYKIHTLDWKKVRKPIPRSKLAHEVAKKVDQHLTRLTVCIPDPTIEDRWRVGQGSMVIDNMFLVSLVSVSRGSFQPEIWIAAPQVTHAHASGGSS